MKKIILTIVSTFTILVSCEVDESLNIDTKNPSAVPAAGLFTEAARQFFDQQQSASVNFNPLRMYAQYWAQTTYPEESQYTQVTRNHGRNIWREMYKDVLRDSEGAKNLILDNPQASNPANKVACIDILQVAAYAHLVEIFGDVPYTEALDSSNPSPKYDDAETVYLDLFTKLDAALASINTSASGFDASQDPIYGGDMSQWKMAGNALKLRMAMRIADSNPSVSQQMAVAAATGIFTDNADNFSITYYSSSPNTNPLWRTLVESGRDDFIAANTLVDAMNDLDDPRRAAFFELHEGAYSGGIYGSANASSGFSALSDQLKAPDLPGAFITAAEVHFLMAEAAARGYAVSGSAEAHYNMAITASFEEWGVEADLAAYMANPDVAWATAPGNDMQKIAMQKWIAMFNNGMEGWTTIRLFDYPILNAIETGEAMPVRFLYPQDEPQLNAASYAAGAAAIGGDLKSTKLFFDVN